MVGFGQRRRKSPNPIVSVSRGITICRLLACYRVGDVACREGTGTGTMIPDDSAFFWGGWVGGGVAGSARCPTSPHSEQVVMTVREGTDTVACGRQVGHMKSLGICSWWWVLNQRQQVPHKLVRTGQR